MDWTLMQRLRCSRRELGDMPYLEVEVFEAFVRGEDAAERQAGSR